MVILREEKTYQMWCFFKSFDLTGVATCCMAQERKRKERKCVMQSQESCVKQSADKVPLAAGQIYIKEFVDM